MYKLVGVLTFLMLLSLSVVHLINQRRKKQPRLPRRVISMLADRDMRIHHYLFHQLRNQWNLISEDLKSKIRELGWEPPRPSRDSNGNFITNNGSGEDFLYMHRKMIEDINIILANGNYAYGKKIIGWVDIPPPNDPDYPVPPTYFLDNAQTTEIITNLKSDNYYWTFLKGQNDNYKNSTFLKTMTLGQLGAFLEFQVHNQMHVRWSKSIREYRHDPDPFYDTGKISERWDDPSYDWMNDFYASHVNAVFWKIHGWVDDRVNDWMRAHNLTEIRWNGTWMGPMGHMSSFLQMKSLSKERRSNSEKVFAMLRSSHKGDIYTKGYKDYTR